MFRDRVSRLTLARGVPPAHSLGSYLLGKSIYENAFRGLINFNSPGCASTRPRVSIAQNGLRGTTSRSSPTMLYSKLAS